MTTPDYDTDLYARTQAQAAALRAKEFATPDLEHLATGIESLGNEQAHAIESHLRTLLTHLLQWRYQPTRRRPRWRRSVVNARQRIERRLRRNPSLCRELPELLASGYADARGLAEVETGLPSYTFPHTSPWAVERVLDREFWPGGSGT